MQELGFLLLVVRNLFSSPALPVDTPPLDLRRLRMGPEEPGQKGRNTAKLPLP